MDLLNNSEPSIASVDDVQSGSKTTSNLVTRWIFSLFIIIIATLHLIAAFLPTGINWGFHLLSFYPTWFKIVIPLTMFVFVLPSVQVRMMRVLDMFTQSFTSLPPKFRIFFAILFIVLCGIVFWSAREGTTFLGDGFWYTYRVPLINNEQNIPIEFKHEPLAGYIVWQLHKILPASSFEQRVVQAYQVVSIFSGIGFMLVSIFLVKRIVQEPIQQLLLYIFIVGSGSTQLFFGYLENYAPAYFLLIVFLSLGISVINRKINAVYPSIIFGVMIVFFFGTIVFIPSFLFLLLKSYRRGEHFNTFLSLITCLLTIYLLLWMCGFTVEELTSTFSKSESHVVPLTKITTGRHGYTMFSYNHILDIINEHILVSAFALFILIYVGFSSFNKLPWKDPKWIFLILTSLSGFVITSIFNCDIGMSRDWDLLSTFILPIIISAGATWFLIYPTSAGKQLLLAMSAITIIHTGIWISVNTNSEKAISRMNILLENTLWGKSAFKVYEEMAIYYRNEHDFYKAEALYKKWLAIDSTSPRVLGNLGDLYRMIGDTAHEIHFYEKAVQYGTKVPEIFQNLGITYAEREEFRKAAEMFSRVIDFDPHRADIINGIGAFKLRMGKDCSEALPFFLRAISENPKYSLSYLNAGLCYEKIGDSLSMKKYLIKFLELDPINPNASLARDILQSSH